MARVTVEDCVEIVPNRFDLVMAAAQRAREISAGAPLTIERHNDRNPVIALREIADRTVDPDKLTETIVRNMQRHVEPDEPEEESIEMTALSLPDADVIGSRAAEEAEDDDIEIEAAEDAVDEEADLGGDEEEAVAAPEAGEGRDEA